MVRWLGEQAEALGVEIYPGFPASEVLFNDKGAVKGWPQERWAEAKMGEPKAAYEPGHGTACQIHGLRRGLVVGIWVNN